MQRNSIGHTLRVAFILCVVCSVLVSTAAVGLRQRQQVNKDRERKTNILIAADLLDRVAESSVDEVYEQRIVERMVDLKSGQFTTEVEPSGFDQRRAARDPELSVLIPAELDAAQVRRRERYAVVYFVRDPNGTWDQLVLPIRGYGLWSTLWGFISLDVTSLQSWPVAMEIRGLTFYEHAETPGLGGEVDNPRWKDRWRAGKRVYDADWNVKIHVTRGTVDADEPQATYQVDGLSGATITANGVTNMMEYWFGEHGFQPFLRNLAKQPELPTLSSGDGEPQASPRGSGGQQSHLPLSDDVKSPGVTDG